MRLFIPSDFNDKKHLYGVNSESFGAMLISEYLKTTADFTLIVTDGESRALNLLDELRFFVGEKQDSDFNPISSSFIDYIPSPDHSVYTDILPDRTAIQKRLSSFAGLMFGYNSRVCITSVQSLMRKTLPVNFFDINSHLLGIGVVFERNKLAEMLLKNGYERTETVEDPGSFAVRGQVIDVFVPIYKYPVRITFWDDEIESLHIFEPSTQKRTREIEELIIYPVRETLPGKTDSLRKKLYELADEADYPASKTRYIMEKIESGEEFFGMETMFPLYHEEKGTLFDYLPDKLKIIIEDPEAIMFSADNFTADEYEKYEIRKGNSQIALPPDEFYISYEKVIEKLENKTDLYIHRGASEDGKNEFSVKVHGSLTDTIKKNESDRDGAYTYIKAKIERYIENGGTAVIAVTSEPYRSPFVKLLEEDKFKLEILDSSAVISSLSDISGKIIVKKGYVKKGFELHDGGFILVTEEEVFGAKVKKRKSFKHKGGTAIEDIETLRPDEPVIHKTHGLGFYRGIYKMSPAGMEGEYILIEYAGGDRFYLPAHKISQLSVYKGGKKENLKPDKLGGKTWEKRKKKVSEKVKKLAEKLLQIASERDSREGWVYPAEDTMLTEFEATFPYEETKDQASAIEDIYNDMASTKPMDRLICGDVGYGKTEVALRAAVLAVIGGKQVALLVPTTLLAEQHYRTFKERLSGFPVEVEAVSRFRSSSKNKQVLEKTAAGQIDILIGTHRILSKDVHFKNLGLLIIDEEQRFGVAQKEKFRFFKPELDVLTLSATPIPRTLHMGIMGVKDISIITTPPGDRMSVQTNVAPADINVIAQAIRKEMARGGQVFAVVPRINVSKGNNKTIVDRAKLIEQAVPEARTAVAHGRLEAQKLERIMIEFISGRYDVLVSTNIIEAGIDISRANTLIVFDAHNFGLAQLYQLRGRVGRGKVKAYAYFLVPGFNKITKEAKRRLLAIQRHSVLGAGFNLASEDLEIRGAGDILGDKQSGNIAAVGFETYVEIVKEAVAELKGEKSIPENDPELNTDISGYLPEEYIPEPSERLKFYRRLSTASDESQVADIMEIIGDMYGPVPPEAEMLAKLMIIKVLLRYMNASGLSISGKKAVLFSDENAKFIPEKLIELMNSDKTITFDGPYKLILKPGNSETETEKIQKLTTMLHKLLSCVNTDV